MEAGTRSWEPQWGVEWTARESASAALRARRRAEARRRTARRKRIERAFLVAALVLLAYSATVVLWRDPVTAVYAAWQQSRLAEALEGAFGSHPDVRSPAAMAAAAEEMQAQLEPGQPLGYLRIPTLDVETAFVHGTRSGADLSKGAGHYPETSLPGRGATVAIAGHRTTFGAPFRQIDELRAGDMVEVEVPYGAFRYRVFRDEIVAPDDWTIMRDRGFETLVLSSCHPVYSDVSRWIVYARLVEARPSDGGFYTPAIRPASETPEAAAVAGTHQPN